MAEKGAELARAETVNCCNGRVGRRLIELAATDERIREFVVPTGVEIVRKAQELGVAGREAVNCCNGRVGRQAFEDLATALGGA